MSEGRSLSPTQNLTFLDGTITEVTNTELDFSFGSSELEWTFVRADETIGTIVEVRLQESPKCKPLNNRMFLNLTIPETVVE